MNARESEKQMSEELPEKAAETVALATVIRDHIKLYPITSDWRTMAGHFGATEHTIARAIIEAGWVGPEERAEYVAMEGRFSELLCDLTDGLLSKTGYDVRAMVQQVEETFQKYADEDIKAARVEAWDAAVEAARVCECALGVHVEHGDNPYRDEEQGA